MSSAGNYILKATLTMVFFYEFCKIMQKTFFYKTQLGEYFSGLTKVEQTILFNETRKMDGVNFKDTAQVLQKIFDLLSRHFSSCAWM